MVPVSGVNGGEKLDIITSKWS